MVLIFAEFRFFRCSNLLLKCLGGGALSGGCEFGEKEEFRWLFLCELMRKIILTSLLGFALVVVLLLPFVSFGVSKEEMKIRRAGMDCASIGSALKAYAEKGARPPTTGQGLEALVERPTVEPLPEDWARIAIQVPLDPWRQPYRYRELARDGILFRWEVRSIGPDGIAGNEDDLAREFEWEGR